VEEEEERTGWMGKAGAKVTCLGYGSYMKERGGRWGWDLGQACVLLVGASLGWVMGERKREERDEAELCVWTGPRGRKGGRVKQKKNARQAGLKGS